MRREFDPGELCGCGSGSRYSLCCKNNRVSYTRDGRGTVFKSLMLDQGGLAAVEEARTRFYEVFGRKPQRKDRLLPDGYAYSPADLRRDMMACFEGAGTPKEIAYAYSETGLLISHENSKLATPADLQEWDEAIERYLAAKSSGLDLLAPSEGPVATKLKEFEELLKLIVIHLGSYADRSPKATQKSAPVFFQYLLIGKAHQCAKALLRGWSSHMKSETFSLLRSVYECALLIRRLHEQGDFANTLFAQALVGRGPFSYRIKKNGETDFSKIVNIESGEHFEGRTSYFECARIASEDESRFFELVYPLLSSNINFDAGDFIREYRKSGSFLIWEIPDKPVQAIFTLAISAYFVISIIGSGAVSMVLKKDMQYLLSKIAGCFYGLYIALDDEDYHVDEHTSLLVFTADRLFRGEALDDVEYADIAL